MLRKIKPTARCCHLFSHHAFPSSNPSLHSHSSFMSPPLPVHLLYCKQLTKAWQGLCKMFPSTSLSPLPTICYCLLAIVHEFVSIACSFFCFSSASEKQKLIKYGTRWSSISLNHHVIKMASLGDQLKRSRRTMSPQSDIYGAGYVNMLSLFAMYISCNYHFL